MDSHYAMRKCPWHTNFPQGQSFLSCAAFVGTGTETVPSRKWPSEIDDSDETVRKEMSRHFAFWLWQKKNSKKQAPFSRRMLIVMQRMFSRDGAHYRAPFLEWVGQIIHPFKWTNYHTLVESAVPLQVIQVAYCALALRFCANVFEYFVVF